MYLLQYTNSAPGHTVATGSKTLKEPTSSFRIWHSPVHTLPQQSRSNNRTNTLPIYLDEGSYYDTIPCHQYQYQTWYTETAVRGDIWIKLPEEIPRPDQLKRLETPPFCMIIMIPHKAAKLQRVPHSFSNKVDNLLVAGSPYRPKIKVSSRWISRAKLLAFRSDSSLFVVRTSDGVGLISATPKLIHCGGGELHAPAVTGLTPTE